LLTLNSCRYLNIAALLKNPKSGKMPSIWYLPLTKSLLLAIAKTLIWLKFEHLSKWIHTKRKSTRLLDRFGFSHLSSCLVLFHYFFPHKDTRTRCQDENARESQRIAETASWI
jgi:hypothetical protein